MIPHFKGDLTKYSEAAFKATSEATKSLKSMLIASEYLERFKVLAEKVSGLGKS